MTSPGWHTSLSASARDSAPECTVDAPPQGQPASSDPAAETDGPPVLLAQLVSSQLVLLAVGASLGAAAFTALNFERLPAFVSNNTMSLAARQRLLLWTALGGVAPPTLGLGWLLWKRSEWAIRQVARVARAVSPLVLAFVLPSLLNWRAFKNAEMLFCLCAVLFSLGLERLLRIAIPALPRWRLPPLPGAGSRWLPLSLVVLWATLLGSYFSYYTILNHLRLQTSSWDLAIFDNMYWNLLRGEWFHATPDLGRTGESHIQYHATFAAYLFTPIYALIPRAETLLAIQGVVVGAAAIPIYLLAKARTSSAWLGVLLALAYGLHAPVHGPVFYDFHFLTLAPFFISWVLYFFETERRNWLIASWLLALALREDQSACMSAAALFFLLSGKRPWWALVGGLLSALYFVVMKFGVMPLHRGAADKQTFTWMFKELIPAGAAGFGGVLQTIGSNPIFTLSSLMEPEKLSYVLKMFGPVLLIPLRFARNWVLFIPAGIFTLLSSGYKPLYQTYFQYTSNWTPYLFYAAAVGLDRIRRGPQGAVRTKAAGFAMLFGVYLFSSNYGAVLGRSNFRGGFRKVQFERTEADLRKYADLRRLMARIPADASVTATETEAPHVSNRRECFTMRFGHYDSDYLLVSIAEVSRGKARKHFEQAVATKRYGFVERSGRLMLWQRGAPQSGNAKGLRLIGREPGKKRRKP